MNLQTNSSDRNTIARAIKKNQTKRKASLRMLMLNKNKTEDNFFTASKVSLSFSDLEEKKKIRNNQDQTEVFGSFI